MERLLTLHLFFTHLLSMMTDPIVLDDDPVGEESPPLPTVSGMKRPGSPVEREAAPEKRAKLDDSLKIIDLILPYLRHSCKLFLRLASRGCRELIDRHLAGKELVIMERIDGTGFIVKSHGYGLPCFCPAVIDPSTPNSPDFHYDYPRPHEIDIIEQAEVVTLSDVRATARLNALLYHLHPSSTVVLDHYERTEMPNYLIPHIEILKINKRPSCGCYNSNVPAFTHGAKQVIINDNHEQVFLDIADLLASMNMDDGICHLLQTLVGPCVEKLVIGKVKGGFTSTDQFKYALERLQFGLEKHPELKVWVLMDEMVDDWRWEYVIRRTTEWFGIWPQQIIVEAVDVYGQSLDKFAFMSQKENGQPYIRVVTMNAEGQLEECYDSTETETVSYTTSEEGGEGGGGGDRYILVIEPDDGRDSEEELGGEAEGEGDEDAGAQGSAESSDSERDSSQLRGPRIVVTSPSL